MRKHKFKIILEQDENDEGYTVTVPALPGCITEWDTIQEALENVQEAIRGYLEALQIQGRPLPDKDIQLFYGEVEVSL